MKSVFPKIFIAILAILWSVLSVQAQSVNMSRYIKLTVKEGADIKLDLWADATGTLVKIVSGNQEKIITVGKDWIGYKGYSAGAGTMTIYGDLQRFDCNSNDDNITALDISHNTELTVLYCYKNALTTLDVGHNNKLKVLYCYGNKFTSAAIDDIFCSLPDMKGQKSGEIQPALDDSSPDNDIVLAANGKNAIDKNWKVRYFDDNSDITGFTGNTECSGVVNMSRYITLIVEKGADILLDIAADAANTPIKIVSGDKEQAITVGTSWTGVKSYTAGDATMTVYGDALKLDCSKNGVKVTGLNTSSNAQLQVLFCYKDSISSLDLSNNEELKSLHCFGDKLTSLDVIKNKQLQWLKCHDNRLTTIDVSHNTQLKYMTCYGNDFATAALDNIYCLLPDRAGQKAGEIQPLLNASSPEKNKVLATNGNNAIARNWKVEYSQNGSVITGFTGTKQCGGGSGVNMDRYITLTVVSGEEINLNLFADADNTPIKIVSGTKEQTVTVGTSWTGMNKYITDGSTMTVYGNVQKFSCGGNGKNITGLDVSHNSQLTILYCDKNAIISLNVSGNTELKNLDCKENAITSLDLSNCKQLKWVYCNKNALTSLNVSECEQLELLKCYENKLTSLDVSNSAMLKMLYCEENALASLDVSRNTELISLYCQQNSISSLNLGGNTKLRILFCYENALNSLDVSKCTQLEWLYCADNPISTLDISHNKHLNTLYCYGNSFTTAALDDIYCSLPDRKGKSKGDIAPLLNASSADKSKVLATNGNNAAIRGWKAIYYEGNAEITGFTGTKQCGGGTGIDEVKDLPSFAVYPNPVKDVLNIATDKPVHSIRIYNVYGTEVAYATDTNSIDVSHLPAGVYMVRADGKATRIIKE